MTLQIAPVARATTSASNLFRRKLCPGSGRLEEGLPEEDSEYSEEGTMLHRLYWTPWAMHRIPSLTPDQRECLEDAERSTQKFFTMVQDVFGIPSGARFVDEKEVHLSFEAANGNPLFPGHADLIRSWPDQQVFAIADAKFGFSEVEEAPDNLQLSVYSAMLAQRNERKGLALVWHNYAVALIQPRNLGPRLTLAHYGPSKLVPLSEEIERIYRASLLPDAPLIAGKAQCQFCKAKPICPAYREKFMAVEMARPRAVSTLSNEEIVEVHTAISFAARIKDDVNTEMRLRVEAGQLPGWKLQRTGDVTVLENAIGLFRQLKSYFGEDERFSATAFDGCREMGWGRLTKLIQEITGMSEKKAKALIDEFAAPFVKKTPKAMRVVREKKALKE